MRININQGKRWDQKRKREKRGITKHKTQNTRSESCIEETVREGKGKRGKRGGTGGEDLERAAGSWGRWSVGSRDRGDRWTTCKKKTNVTTLCSGDQGVNQLLPSPVGFVFVLLILHTVPFHHPHTLLTQPALTFASLASMSVAVTCLLRTRPGLQGQLAGQQLTDSTTIVSFRTYLASQHPSISRLHSKAKKSENWSKSKSTRTGGKSFRCTLMARQYQERLASTNGYNRCKRSCKLEQRSRVLPPSLFLSL